MQVLSAFSSSYTQNKNIQYGGAEYLHKAVKYGGSDKIIEFTDRESQRKIQFYSDSSMEKLLQKKFGADYVEDGNVVNATGKFESYLQDMWFRQNITENTVDLDNDGYLDVSEMANAIRNVDITFDSLTNDVKVELFSSRDISSSEEAALENVEEYFKSKGFFNNKVTVDQDFNTLLKVDTNLDGNIEDMEILANMHPSKLMEYESLSIGEKRDLFSMIEAWKKKRDKENATVDDSQINSKNLTSHSSLLNQLLESQGESNTLSMESTKTFSFDKLKEIKMNLPLLSKYVDTQANNAKIFSLKI